eukprot:TRINITY_DN11864_c0_g1_i3.p1 TRINITY_DN11864_c0_g1~~TRINITY_DN11864_c0_g1_i3.p1  ORF type:complete len:324 (+),score=61.22 TRINITY_DN11864_c0_g1_i3:454-1425(+)
MMVVPTGTYNSQWMMVDLEAFEDSKNKTRLKKGVLVVFETVPGENQHMDATDLLEEHSYWASFNIPYFELIYNEAGYHYIDDYSSPYDESSERRAVLFRELHRRIWDVKTMKRIMLYNPWRANNTQPPRDLAERILFNSPADSFMPRYDLSEFYMEKAKYGGIDCKIVNSSMTKDMQVHAISGPNHQDQDPFEWTDEDNEPHRGQPTVWDFNWLEITAESILEGTTVEVDAEEEETEEERGEIAEEEIKDEGETDTTETPPGGESGEDVHIEETDEEQEKKEREQEKVVDKKLDKEVDVETPDSGEDEEADQTMEEGENPKTI